MKVGRCTGRCTTTAGAAAAADAATCGPADGTSHSFPACASLPPFSAPRQRCGGTPARSRGGGPPGRGPLRLHRPLAAPLQLHGVPNIASRPSDQRALAPRSAGPSASAGRLHQRSNMRLVIWLALMAALLGCAGKRRGWVGRCPPPPPPAGQLRRQLLNLSRRLLGGPPKPANASSCLQPHSSLQAPARLPPGTRAAALPRRTPAARPAYAPRRRRPAACPPPRRPSSSCSRCAAAGASGWCRNARCRYACCHNPGWRLQLNSAPPLLPCPAPQLAARRLDPADHVRRHHLHLQWAAQRQRLQGAAGGAFWNGCAARRPLCGAARAAVAPAPAGHGALHASTWMHVPGSPCVQAVATMFTTSLNTSKCGGDANAGSEVVGRPGRLRQAAQPGSQLEQCSLRSLCARRLCAAAHAVLGWLRDC